MVHLYLAEGFEETEALGTADVLRRGGIEVCLVSVGDGLLVRGSHGIGVMADALFDAAEAEASEMMIFPGGLPGTVNLGEHEGLMNVMESRVRAGKAVADICAAPSLLGRRHLLEGRKATCYPGFDEYLLGATYTGNYAEVDGNLITGKGPGAVFDFALAIVEHLKGAAVAAEVKGGMLLA